MYDAAVSQWQSAMSLTGDTELAGTLMTAFQTDGFEVANRTLARGQLDRLNQQGGSGGYVPAIRYARTYLRLGDQELAFEWLRKAAQERNVFALLIGVDPFYDTLRSDPRFSDLLNSVALGS